MPKRGKAPFFAREACVRCVYSRPVNPRSLATVVSGLRCAICSGVDCLRREAASCLSYLPRIRVVASWPVN